MSERGLEGKVAVVSGSGGYRQSGLGRENGLMGFEEHLETKVIALPVRTPSNGPND